MKKIFFIITIFFIVFGIGCSSFDNNLDNVFRKDKDKEDNMKTVAENIIICFINKNEIELYKILSKKLKIIIQIWIY